MKKCVLITGASRGIGRAIATEFAKNGYSLILNCHHSKELLLNLKQKLQTSYGIEVLTSIGNIGNFSYVSTLFEEITEQFGGVDIVVNNAGISHIGLLTDMTPEEWQTIINTNLSSVFYTTKLAVPYMVTQQCGKIINISSVWVKSIFATTSHFLL